MNVVAVEVGERPRLMTKARRFAPEGVKVLAETLGHMQFADDALVVLDWSNATGNQPEDAHYPVVYITTIKEYKGRYLHVNVRINVEDTFGRDALVAEDILVIIRSMEQKNAEAIERAKGEE